MVPVMSAFVACKIRPRKACSCTTLAESHRLQHAAYAGRPVRSHLIRTMRNRVEDARVIALLLQCLTSGGREGYQTAPS